MISPGDTIRCNGVSRVVKDYRAEWSLALRSGIPHRLFILWEGETKYQRFLSDATGSFAELDKD